MLVDPHPAAATASQPSTTQSRLGAESPAMDVREAIFDLEHAPVRVRIYRPTPGHLPEIRR
jgi:hypothetical protein